MRTKLMNVLIPMSLTLASLPAAVQTTGDRPDYWHYGWDWGWGHMIFGSLMMILFWGGIILVIDLASYEVTASISTGPLPNYAIFSPDGGRLYVSNAGNDTVSEVDTARWIVLRNTLAGNSPEHMVLSHDGRRLYVANVDDGTVSEVVTESGSTLRIFDIGGPLHGLDLSKNGRTLFIRALGQDKLVAINLHSLEKREAPLAPAPYHLASVGGTGKLYVSSAEQPNVWVVDQKDLVVLGKISIDAIEFNNAIACIDSFIAPLKRNSGVGSRPPPRPDASPISRHPSSPLLMRTRSAWRRRRRPQARRTRRAGAR